MSSDNPSLLIQNWRTLTMEAKTAFLEYLVSQLEAGAEAYSIAEYSEIFLLTVFLNTERENIVKEKEAETYVEPALEEPGTQEIISDQRVYYILRMLANNIVRLRLPWGETLKIKIKLPIEAEDLFEARFYQKCIEAKKNLEAFIEERANS